MERDDTVAPATEHWTGHEHVMQLADGVPAGQEDEDGTISHAVTDVLNDFHGEVKVYLALVNVP